MPDKIRAGLLGISHAHAIGKLRTIQSSPEYELVGVCEPNAELQQQRKDEDVFKGVRWLSEPELLGDETVQLVAVEGRVQDNLDLARRAVEAGKHIHLDKPAGKSLDEFKALLDLVQQKNLLLQMGYQFRYNTGFELAMKALNEGWLGEIFFVHGSIGSTIGPESRRELTFHPGGMMFELACHLIDTLVALLGRPQDVTPFMRHDAALDDQLADNTLAVFQFERAIAVMESAAMEIQSGQRRKLEICGTEGTIVVQPIEPPAVRLCLSQAHEDFQVGWQSVSVPNIPRYLRDFEELARCVRGEQQPGYSLEHDFIVQETLLRACGTVT
ncbi:Gfo/Idh/MocA family oxidoreductase [bacterium]|nr:Gfo/Idh/MocA family oxidoreductase [bacterium]